MDSEKIIQDLNRRFAQPLPPYYKRRIITWIDEDAEFADQIGDMALENAKILVLTGSNNFYAKKLLAADDPTSNYLVYRPFGYAELEDNWLLDTELYGEEFRSDLVSLWMEEMNLPALPTIRQSLKKYRKFFNAQGRRSKLAALGFVPSTQAQLQGAIMATLAGLKMAKPGAILKAVLEAGIEKDSNLLYQEFVTYDMTEAFWRMVKQGTGYEAAEGDLHKMVSHLLLTAASRTLRPELLSGLAYSAAHQAYCYDFVSDWMHSRDVHSLFDLAELVEDEANLPQRFLKMQVGDLLQTEIFPCIDVVILRKLMKDIGDHNIDVEAITNAVEKRRTCVWYDKTKQYYEGILQVAKMEAFYKEHAGGFHTVEPAKVWKEYTTEYYHMDTYYRTFDKCYAASLLDGNEHLDELFGAVQETAEGLYATWFLGELGNNWSDACAEQMRKYGCVLEVPQQIDFYAEQVRGTDSKVYVIISDALRYEVGASLAEQLLRETQATVTLKSMQAVFPTATKYGMAALLPNQGLSVDVKSGKNERLAMLAMGQSTEAANRDKVLKAANAASVALKYHELIGLKRAERQALVRGMNVVYIYHDTIDEAGHGERDIFPACDTAMDELKNMVRIITNEWGGAKVLITADHGFLYTRRSPREEDKVDVISQGVQPMEWSRRYAILPAGAQPPYLMPVQFFGGQTGYEAFTPRESIRLTKKGGSTKFVHGGISLQEMVVPLIEYHFLRNQSKQYLRNKAKYDTKPVEIGLLSSDRKISNLIFSLGFYQKEPVGGVREAAVCQLYFADKDGQVISDCQKLIADRTSDNGQERIFQCSFNLKSRKYSSTETYFLVQADENGLAIQREEFQIDIAFAVDEFDFFG